jgi:hypothetical protein
VYYTYLMTPDKHESIYRHLICKDGTISKIPHSVKPRFNTCVHEFGTTGVASILKSLTGPLRWSN